MIYAPVLIPTLNRVDHLKELIYSLQKNRYAEYTELYISVDYPPDESYVDGYELVKTFLLQGIKGFKQVNVFFQEENLGANGNCCFLGKEVQKKYDRYIFSEDDNIFSPNFLEYMDKCLELYEDDDEIIAICGHMVDAEWGLPNNVLIKNSIAYNAWGVGQWVRKERELSSELSLEYLDGILRNARRALRLYRDNDYFFRLCVECVIKREGAMFTKNGEFALIDQVRTIYLNDKHRYVINPGLSKVKNCGDDGSGLHCGDDNRGKYQTIDDSDVFDGTNVTLFDNRKFLLKKYRAKCKNTWKRNLYTLLLWGRYYLFHV